MTRGDARPRSYVGPFLHERGARAVGQWPSDDPYKALLAVLDRRIYDEKTDPETKGKLSRLRESFVDVGQGVGTGVLSSLIRAAAGLP